MMMLEMISIMMSEDDIKDDIRDDVRDVSQRLC